MDIKDILARCDHTLLRTDCTAAEIRALCDDAIRFGCASVCIPPAHVAGAKRYVNGQMKICTVIGFPNGYDTTKAKCLEALDAVQNGAERVIQHPRMMEMCPTSVNTIRRLKGKRSIGCLHFGNRLLLIKQFISLGTRRNRP